MGIEAAIIGSAVVGAGASMVGGSKAAKAQTAAAAQQAAVEREGIALQERQFQQSREDLAPWREQGVRSLGELARMTSPDYDYGELRRDPEFQFRHSQGQRSLSAYLGNKGLTESGAALKEMVRFGDGLAADTYGNRWNRLAGLAGVGQSATNTTASLGQSMAGNVQQGLSNIGNSYAAAGNARASSYANTGAAIGNLANSIGGYYAQQGTLSKLLGSTSGTGAYRPMYSPSFNPLFG